MAKVVYLLGAGASGNCIPIVSGTGDKIRELSVFLAMLRRGRERQSTISIVSGLTDEEKSILRKGEKLLNTLGTNCEKHASIDTYAKKLFINNPQEFQKLKNMLCFYFSLVQIINPTDQRYDNFFASVLEPDGNIPANLTIVSWNYDFQIERSYSEFCDIKELEEVRSKLGLCSPKSLANDKEVNIFKLNGSARAWTNNSKLDYLLDSASNDVTISILHLCKTFFGSELDLNYGDKSDLSFAWEHELTNSFFKSLKRKLEGVEVLAIIGYSFPFFNRKIDAYIFKQLPFLKKIYIQDPNADIVRETIDEIYEDGIPKKIKVVLKSQSSSQFVFPRELNNDFIPKRVMSINALSIG